MYKKHSCIVLTLTLIAIAAVIPAIYAEETNDWQKAPTFASGDVVWMLAPNQTEPQIGDVVFAVPTVKNTTTPDADDPPQPIITIAPTQPPTKEDNTLLTAALIITISFIPLLLISLLRRKAKATASLAFIAFLTCSMLFTAYNVPAASADQMAKTGYKLANPTGMSDYQLHNYTDGSFGVNRMSDWANLVTFMGYVGGNPAAGLITPTLAGYSTNASAIWENIFAVISYGVVESKEVAVGYSTGLEAWQTAIPDDVQVDVSYQGNMYRFANPLNTAGSPYTVSVGSKMLSGNYTAEDSKGRILWSSLNCSYVVNSVVNSMTTSTGRIIFGNGVFTFDSPVEIKAGLVVEGQGMESNNVDSHKTTVLTVANNSNCNIFQYTGTDYIYFPQFINICFEGNKANNATGSAISTNTKVCDGLISRCFFEKWSNYSVYIGYNWNWRVEQSTFEYCDTYALYGGNEITSCKFLYNVYCITLGERVTNCYFFANNKTAINGVQQVSQCKFESNGNQAIGYSDIILTTAEDPSIIQGNEFFGGSLQAYGVNVNAGATNCQIKNNYFENYVWAAIANAGTGTIVSGNVGFVTEQTKSVTNTTATTFVFNHGLASNATWVQATFNCPASVTSWTWTSTPTQVTITVTGTNLPASMTVYADVKYVP